MMVSYKVRTHIYKDPHTFVEIEDAISVSGKTIRLIGRGFAKRNACDQPNKDIGYEVAAARAVEDLRQQRTNLKIAMKKKAGAR
jgi:hypothetical protein